MQLVAELPAAGGPLIALELLGLSGNAACGDVRGATVLCGFCVAWCAVRPQGGKMLDLEGVALGEGAALQYAVARKVGTKVRLDPAADAEVKKEAARGAEGVLREAEQLVEAARRGGGFEVLIKLGIDANPPARRLEARLLALLLQRSATASHVEGASQAMVGTARGSIDKVVSFVARPPGSSPNWAEHHDDPSENPQH